MPQLQPMLMLGLMLMLGHLHQPALELKLTTLPKVGFLPKLAVQ